MQHPKDVKGSDKPKSLLSIPVGQRYTTIINRLDDIVDVVGHLESDVNDLDGCYSDVIPRLDRIESEIKVMHHVVGKNILTLNQIEERIAIMQEKIDGVDQEEDSFEELSNEEYLLADEICLEIKEYMSQFVDTDEKVVDNLCEIVKHRIVGGSDGID